MSQTTTGMKISTQRIAGRLTIKVEGRFVGPATTELEGELNGLRETSGYREVIVDLRDLTFADSKGIQLLAKACKTTQAEFLADTPLTRYFVEKIRQQVAVENRDTSTARSAD